MAKEDGKPRSHTNDNKGASTSTEQAKGASAPAGKGRGHDRNAPNGGLYSPRAAPNAGGVPKDNARGLPKDVVARLEDGIRPYTLALYRWMHSPTGPFIFGVWEPASNSQPGNRGRRRSVPTDPGERATIADDLSVAVYVDSDDVSVQQATIDAASRVRIALGYGDEGEIDIVRGSIFRRSRAWLSKSLSSEEVQTRLIKIERAVELTVLESKQAAYDSIEAEAVKNLIESLAEVERASVRIGSILVVKYKVGDETVVLVRNLSQAEVRALERFPEIQTRPDNVFHALGIAISAMDDASVEHGVVEGNRAVEG
jgi:hypothetical protein